jgi:hypothetical protein
VSFVTRHSPWAGIDGREYLDGRKLLHPQAGAGSRRRHHVDGSGAARLAAIPAGESPANRGVQSLL